MRHRADGDWPAEGGHEIDRALIDEAVDQPIQPRLQPDIHAGQRPLKDAHQQPLERQMPRRVERVDAAVYRQRPILPDLVDHRLRLRRQGLLRDAVGEADHVLVDGKHILAPGDDPEIVFFHVEDRLLLPRDPQYWIGIGDLSRFQGIEGFEMRTPVRLGFHGALRKETYDFGYGRN